MKPTSREIRIHRQRTAGGGDRDVGPLIGLGDAFAVEIQGLGVIPVGRIETLTGVICFATAPPRLRK